MSAMVISGGGRWAGEQMCPGDKCPIYTAEWEGNGGRKVMRRDE